MLRKWLEKRKRESEEIKKNREEEINARLQSAIKEIKKKEDEMTSKPCAVRPDFENCTRLCVHFSKGCAFKMLSFDLKTEVIRTVYPRCKLWSQ